MNAVLGLWLWLAAASGPPVDRFEALLRAIDTLPSRAELVGAFPDAAERLTQAALDPGSSRDAWTRRRAIAFLSLFPSVATRETLEALTDSPDPEVRRIAVYTLGRAFGHAADRALVLRVAGATADAEPQVAMDAARALRWVSHPMAGEALEALRRHHPRAELRRVAETALARRP
jgi:HEAT repeat protein